MPAARRRGYGQEWPPNFQPWMKSRVRPALDEQRESCNIVGSVLDAARPRKGLRPPSRIICVQRTSFSLICGHQATVKGARHVPLPSASPRRQPAPVEKPGQRPLPSLPAERSKRDPPDRTNSSELFRVNSGRNRRCRYCPGGCTTRDCAGVGL